MAEAIRAVKLLPYRAAPSARVLPKIWDRLPHHVSGEVEMSDLAIFINPRKQKGYILFPGKKIIKGVGR
ncbi:MAG: hypothetical protein GX081_11970 [Firmicutes bacterium]|nr:hypothetical protein [Bacillota bacterium]